MSCVCMWELDLLEPLDPVAKLSELICELEVDGGQLGYDIGSEYEQVVIHHRVEDRVQSEEAELEWEADE